MADIIQLLPDAIANQIAAGEVVQRPASVVKELLENAVDAGAKTVKVVVQEAGKQLIQVSDDGAGMSETDARMAFERHATSKIRNVDDLYRLHTFGFRGEALASIASAAKVELKTKRQEDDLGAMVVVEGGRLVKHESCACPNGTVINVKNLFFSIPARRNFLKGNQVELKHIIEEFLRAALAYPEVKFVLVNEDEELYHLNSGTLRQRMVHIFGKKYDQLLVPVSEETDILKLEGFIGKPEAAKKKGRGEQYFFANGRYIRSGYLNHAVQMAYEDLLPPDHQPLYVLKMQLPEGKLDVNVHPTKTEIKLEDEKAVYSIIRSAIRKSLSQYHVAPSLSFDREDSMDQALHPPKQPERVRLQSGGGFPQGGNSALQQKASQQQWEELYKVLQMDKPEQEGTEQQQEQLVEQEENQKEPIQLHRKFIFTPIRSGMMILHQQLAHERVLYEKYLRALQQQEHYSQQQLFPEVLELPPADFQLMTGLMDEVKRLGFIIEKFGTNTLLVSGVPADLRWEDVQSSLQQLIEEYRQNLQHEKLDKRENLARVVARSAAIKAGKVLNKEQMVRLIDELFACQMPYYSPDGKPTLITISSAELEKKFVKK